MSLDFKDAGSAALDNPEALAQMRDIWQANVQKMAQLVRKRGWTITDEPPTTPVGLSSEQLDKLEAHLGEPLPKQLRWLLSWAGEWQFGWDLEEDDELPSELEDDISDGCLEWSAQLLEEENLRGQLSGWVEYHQEVLESEEDDEESSEETIKAYAAFWQAHFPFSRTAGGDLITIDTRNPDPQRQPVRYFFHELEGDDLEGMLLAPNLFSFISRLTALGCAGSEPMMGWGLFWRDEQHGLDLQSEEAQQWLTWLAASTD